MGPALLFCPADRPERYQKAAERADAVIVDLEDAVAPADKQRARGAILAQLGATGDVPELDPSRTIVRINPAGTEEFEKDLHCLKHTPYRHVMLAKAESAEQLRELEGYSVIALCETALGVVNAALAAYLLGGCCNYRVAARRSATRIADRRQYDLRCDLGVAHPVGDLGSD